MKKKEKKPNKKLEAFLRYFGIADAYFAAMFLAVVFALFCSGRVGWFVLLVMIFAPVLSLVWTGVSLKGLQIELDSKAYLLERGDKSKFCISVKSKFFIVPPLVIIKLREGGHIAPVFEEENREIRIYSSAINKGEEWIDFSAEYAGKADISIEEISVCDIFGVFNFKVKSEKLSEIITNNLEIGILPRDGIIQKEEEWLLQAREAAFDGEEPEDSLDDTSYMFGGFPGYDHREYRPGDPLKRINYKLSARVGSLQIRLDEKQAVAGISISLVDFMPEEKAGGSSAMHTSACLEEMLAVCKYLYLHDFAVTAYLQDDVFIITNEEDIEKLRQRMATVRYSVNAEGIPLPQKGSVILFAPFADGRIHGFVNEYAMGEDNVVTLYISSKEEGGRL